MSSSSSQYRSWALRAESFVRQLNHHSRRWGISIAIAPPISSIEADRLAETLPLGLPVPLRRFYTEVAGAFRCQYQWSPNEADLPQVEGIFQQQQSLWGGLELIPWNELGQAHEAHQWWVDLKDSLSNKQAEACAAWRCTVPFINVGNGDYVALHIGEDSQTQPVVYLCHDDPDGPVIPLSPSFDHFLTDWETLHYVGPEIWLLDPFLSEKGLLQLNSEQEQVRQWRKLLEGARE